MSQEIPVKRSPEVLELEELAANYDLRKEAYGQAAALLRQFGEQLGRLELLIEESQQYSVDDLAETLRQKMRSLVDRTIPSEGSTGDSSGAKTRRSKEPRAATAAEKGPPTEGAKSSNSGEYSPQPIARRKLIQIFVDQGAPKESLQSVGQAAANGIRGTVFGLYHYRIGQPYKGKRPSAVVDALARQLGLKVGGGDEDRWSSLVQDLLEQQIISIEDSNRLHGQEQADAASS